MYKVKWYPDQEEPEIINITLPEEHISSFVKWLDSVAYSWFRTIP